MDIVCERFTTSKLSKYEDLTSVATYGFRGEALASISHVAHVSIISRTADSKCAYRGQYSDGKLTGPVKPHAGNVGTQITAEDLFYNTVTRRKALKNPAEEHSRIVEVVSRYAVHNAQVGFCVKKHGENISDVRTPPNSTVLENIRLIYGAPVSRELLEVSCEDVRLAFKMVGHISKANYSMKKELFLLFINHRLVESSALKKALDSVYSAYLPKHSHPFVYMSLEIASHNVDINVHPTKQEVHFLHEDGVIEAIQRAVETCLLSCNSSRVFYTQALLPSVQDQGCNGRQNLDAGSSASSSGKAPTVYPQQMIRTDSREQKLDAFLKPAPKDHLEGDGTLGKQHVEKKAGDSAGTADDERRDMNLTSLLTLRKELEGMTHTGGLREIFKEHKFVGSVDKEYALMQHQTKLYLVNTTRFSQDLFYQLLIQNFGNFGVLRLSEPAPLVDLLLLALELPQGGWCTDDGPKEDLASYGVSFLKSKAEMLSDYFSIDIDDAGNLCTLPLLLEGYIPALDRLPLYVLRLVTEVNWEEEKECFDTVCRETSHFYAVQKELFPNSKKEATQEDSKDWMWPVEHVVFPAFRNTLLPTRHRSSDGSLLQIASLPDLYKVFERC